ncbi:hypothetical protein D3C72_1933970 [compost metagenome]
MIPLLVSTARKKAVCLTMVCSCVKSRKFVVFTALWNVNSVSTLLKQLVVKAPPVKTC